MTNPCLTCKFANWRKTATGRLHPGGDGRCGWKMPAIAIPKAFYYSSTRDGSVPAPSGGGYIERKDATRTAGCPTYEAL